MIESGLYDLVHTGDVQGVWQWLDNQPDDLNTWIGDRYAPLHVACLFGHESVARHLIARGALINLHALNDSGAEPLHLAVQFRDEDTAVRIVRLLLGHGAELNGIQRGGQTALHHSVARGSLKLVAALIEAGADPFLKDGQGRSAADLAQELAIGPHAESIQTELKKAFRLTSAGSRSSSDS